MIGKVVLTTNEQRRKTRTRARLRRSPLPRVSVFKSNKRFSAQLIDDLKGRSLTGVVGKKDEESIAKLAEDLAKKARALKIKKVKFDRGSYRYHGKVKQFADALRKQGLQF